MGDPSKPPWEQDHYSFSGPGVAISCEVDYDRERECYLAIGSAGHRGTGESPDAAALACFMAWTTSHGAWYEADA